MDWQSIKEFLIDNAVLLGSLAAVAAIVGFLIAPIRNLLSRKKPTETADLAAIVDRLAEEARRHGAAASELEGAAQREGGLQEQVRQLSAAVEALSAERSDPDAPPGIDEALALLKDGETGAAEAVFEEVKTRRKAEGEGALKEAAAAARHIGALAFLHDTDKALAAYREAVVLDPDDPDGWNQLGDLLRRIGDLDGATEAYNRVLSLGNRTANRTIIATATGNLGILSATRGEFDSAEEMFRKSLEIEEALGRKAGMAHEYGNLGIVYQTQGDLDRAEDMYRKSLELNEALGRKEGVAKQYGNLGVLYKARGEFDRAEEMYRKSLEIDEALGRKEGMANQYGNLGNLYQTRRELDRAEEMYRKSLELDEALGRKEGMADNYGDLGNLYQTWGEIESAEEMYRKSLEINEALGRKQGMATQYCNLGNLYQTRGELDRAEEMHRKSLGLFREIGAVPMIEKVEGLLAKLLAAK